MKKQIKKLEVATNTPEKVKAIIQSINQATYDQKKVLLKLEDKEEILESIQTAIDNNSASTNKLHELYRIVEACYENIEWNEARK